jgi:uncharacterized delta-60 repeat protein
MFRTRLQSRSCRRPRFAEPLEPRLLLAAADLDPTFGGDGMVTTDFSDRFDSALAISVQPDGKILTAGGSLGESDVQLALARYNADGSLDPTFGSGGRITHSFGEAAVEKVSMVLLGDGKFVVTGTVSNGNDFDMGVARFLPDGSLDPSFSTDGKVLVDFGGEDDSASDVAVEGSGTIIVVGPTFNGVHNDFGIARLEADGDLDLTFSDDGKAVVSFTGGDSHAQSVVVQSDGRIVVGGETLAGASYDFALVRLETNGTLDTTYASGGRLVFSATGDPMNGDYLEAMTLDGSGRIVAAGTTFQLATANDFVVFRVTAGGTLDAGFNAGGIAVTDINGEDDDLNDVVVQPDGKILAVGGVSVSNMTSFKIVRYLADGSLDGSFDGDGRLSLAIDGNRSGAAAGALDAAGRILVAGVAGIVDDDDPGDFALIRLMGSATSAAETIGVYDPSGLFHLRNSNSTGFADFSLRYGPGGNGWSAIVGDWDNTGTDTAGLNQSSTGLMYLRNSQSSGVADITFAYGPPNDNWVPIAGNWDGIGGDCVGLYDPDSAVFYLRNTNSAGFADVAFQFGPAGSGWIPLAGDWDGDGDDTVGLYDRAAGVVYLRNTNTTGVADVQYAYGPAGNNWIPVAGNWNGGGSQSVGLYDPAAAVFYQRFSQTAGVADRQFAYGAPNSNLRPLAGAWTGGGAALVLDEQPIGARAAAAPAPSDLALFVGAALARLASQLGLSLEHKGFDALWWEIDDLPGRQLGLQRGDTVTIDVDAAGRGWFVDPTPMLDEEFAVREGRLEAVDEVFAGSVDLLTVVLHEVGHWLGLEHSTDASDDNLMMATLPVGVRRRA